MAVEGGKRLKKKRIGTS